MSLHYLPLSIQESPSHLVLFELFLSSLSTSMGSTILSFLPKIWETYVVVGWRFSLTLSHLSLLEHSLIHWFGHVCDSPETYGSSNYKWCHLDSISRPQPLGKWKFQGSTPPFLRHFLTSHCKALHYVWDKMYLLPYFKWSVLDHRSSSVGYTLAWRSSEQGKLVFDMIELQNHKLWGWCIPWINTSHLHECREWTVMLLWGKGTLLEMTNHVKGCTSLTWYSKYSRRGPYCSQD